MSNKNEVFEYLIDQLRQQVNSNQCEDLSHEVQSLKNQLRDASARETELQKALNLLGRQVSVLANKFPHEPEQYGCGKEDAQVAEPWVKWEGGECPVPKDTIVQIRMRDGTGAREPGVAGELRWGHRGWPGDITRYRVDKPECEHEWQFYGVGFPCMCLKCGLKK